MNTFDCIVVGAGIIGLAIAREVKRQYPKLSVLVLEKESASGLHASGRNSGVLHSGLYYEPGSIKAKVCVQGSRLMMQYCEERNLALKRIGKVIVPTHIDQEPMLKELARRSRLNGVKTELLGRSELEQIEPWVHSVSDSALYVPGAAVVDPNAILHSLCNEMRDQNVEIRFGAGVKAVDPEKSVVTTSAGKYTYGHLFNAAGLYADKVAHGCGAGESYTMLPFRGSYKQVVSDSKITFNGLVYPVPDLRLPFLGVHFTKSIDGKVYIGPTATPVISRENYSGWEGFRLSESFSIAGQLLAQYVGNKQGFRSNAHQELKRRFSVNGLLKVAQQMVPALTAKDIKACAKVGIRAQLLNVKKSELMMDFVVEHVANTTHVLNAVSPAFTSAFSFVNTEVVKF